MGDYGRPVEFGFFPVPYADRYERIVADVTYADGVGLDLVGIQDHPYQARYLETWSLISDLAARTSRVRFFPDVANLPLRNPAVLAKAAATIDRCSGGRFELGLGAGAFWDAIVAMGGPRREPAEAVAALAEAIEVIRLMWSDARSVRFPGTYYPLAGAHPGPTPAHPVGIWLGAVGPRMLALTGRTADGWVPSSSYVPPEALPGLQNRIDEAAAGAGRDPSAVRRVYNVSGRITDGPAEGFLDGPPQRWVDDVTALVVERGMDTFVLWPDEADVTGQLRRWAEEVVPAVREAVAQERR